MKLVDLSNPIALATIIANSNANSIPVSATGTAYASQAEGFPHITMIPEDNGGEAPHGLDFNGFLKMLSSHVFNIQNGSPETFNPAVSALIGGYPKNAQLWLIDDNNSRLLKSTKDDNTDNFLTTPSVIGTSWVDAFPTKDYVDNNFVTLNTAQTITGEKTFTKEITEKVNMTKGTAPAASMYPKPYKINDSADSMVGNIQFTYGQNMSAGLGMLVYNCNDTTDSTPAALQVYNNNGVKYATCPTPTEDTTGSIQIDTVGARNTKLGNYVTLTGNQTIGGTKTFSSTISGSINGNAATVTNGVYTTGSQSIAGKKTFTNAPYIAMTHPSIHEQKTELTKGTAPTNDQDTSGGISFVDKDDKVLADILFGYTTDKETLVALRPHKANASGDTAVSALTVAYPASGNPYASCPLAANNAVSNEIITANWILPNYSKATNKSAGTTYTPTKDVRVMIAGTIQNSGDNGSMEARVQIGGSDKFTIYGGYVYGYNEDPFFITFDVRAGVSYRLYKVTGTLTVKQFIEIPFGG